MRRIVLSTLVGAIAAGLLVLPFGSAPAQAQPSIEVMGPYRTKADCVTVQNEFLRYHRITYYCRYVPSSGYYFNYDTAPRS